MADNIYGAVYAGCVTANKTIADMLIMMASLINDCGELGAIYTSNSQIPANLDINRNLARGVVAGLCPLFNDFIAIDAVVKSATNETDIDPIDVEAAVIVSRLIHYIIYGWPEEKLRGACHQFVDNEMPDEYKRHLIDIIFKTLTDTTTIQKENTLPLMITIINNRLQQRLVPNVQNDNVQNDNAQNNDVQIAENITHTDDVQIDNAQPDVQIDNVQNSVQTDNAQINDTNTLPPVFEELYGGVLGLIQFILQSKKGTDPVIVMTDVFAENDVTKWLSSCFIGAIIGYRRLYQQPPYFDGNANISNGCRLFISMVSGLQRRVPIGRIRIDGVIGIRYVHPPGEPDVGGRWSVESYGNTPLASVPKMGRVTYIEYIHEGRPYRFRTALEFIRWAKNTTELSEQMSRTLFEMDKEHAKIASQTPMLMEMPAAK